VTAPPVADTPAEPSVGDAPPTSVVPPLDPAPEPRRSGGRAVVIAVLTLLVLGALLISAYWLLASGGDQRVSVPSIQGSTRAEAEAKLRDAGLRAAFVHRRGPDDETRNRVVAQSPGPDAEVEPGSMVTAEINVGPATTKIPGGLVGRNVDKAMEKLADAGFTNVKAMPIDNPPKGADPDDVVAVDPAEGERAALEEDVVLSYVGKAAEPGTRGPTARGGATTKNRPTDKESSGKTDASSPAKESTRSTSPEDDETSASDPTATTSSAPTETAVAPSGAPANSVEPSGQESVDSNPGEVDGGIPLPSLSDLPPAGGDAPAMGERFNP
jgi:eukaryotic-like serine/threonine-protein kinase